MPSALPPLDPQTGCLPIGRYQTTLSEVRKKFVGDIDDARGLRDEIWNEFLTVTEALQSITKVPAVWIGGSFISTESTPKDIDAVFLIDSNFMDSQHGGSREKLNAFSFEQLSKEGYRVDAYILDWRPRASAKPDVEEQAILYHRGYWDEWLQRRPKDKNSEQPDNAIPRRGYVEVILSGYTTT